MKRDLVYRMIDAERVRQAAKWSGDHDWGKGDCSSRQVAPEVKVMVLSEEVGEVSRAVLDADWLGLHAELVQVAAVAVAWLEAWDGPLGEEHAPQPSLLDEASPEGG